MATTRTDPYFGYNFAVELDGITSMGFKTCAGLDTSTTSTKYREGTDVSLAQRELPALLHHTAITLTRGISADHALFDWRNDIASGRPIAATSRSSCVTTLGSSGSGGRSRTRGRPSGTGRASTPRRMRSRSRRSS